MKILHIVPHLGGGVGTVIMGWVEKDKGNEHCIYCIEPVNEKAQRWAVHGHHSLVRSLLSALIRNTDIVIVHYWHRDSLMGFLRGGMDPCRLIFWCHNNTTYSEKELAYPDLWFDTSPVQGHGRHIWSTGGVDRFLEIKPKAHEGFNIGYVGTIDFKKMHPDIFKMCNEIGRLIPESRFTFVGENKTTYRNETGVTFTGKVDDVAPYLAEMDVFGYPLRPDHYGTSEQVLGEAMAAGVVPVVMNNPTERIIVEDGVSGFIGHTMQHYVDHFNYLRNNHRRFSESCRERAKELYSIDTMISRWNSVFEELMQKPKTRKEGL